MKLLQKKYASMIQQWLAQAGFDGSWNGDFLLMIDRQEARDLIISNLKKHGYLWAVEMTSGVKDESPICTLFSDDELQNLSSQASKDNASIIAQYI